MIGLGSARAGAALAIVATVLAAAASAVDLQGWRTPDGRLYFGAEPPPGSAKIDAVHSTPTRIPTPTEKIPAARQHEPGPESERLRLDALPAWQRKPACADIVSIRDARPTIDFEADRLTVSGEVFVARGGPVKDVRVCLRGSCTLVADGKILVAGDSARFTLTVSGQRPKGLTIECFVPK
jgi:hypothetical protein